jgi:hypothetical protein
MAEKILGGGDGSPRGLASLGVLALGLELPGG